jgi:hypothetical protein
MAKEAKSMTGESVKTPTPKEGPVDLTKRVKMTTTDAHPFHKEGKEVNISPILAEKYKLNGWAK